jgi:hypothetical protein
MVRDITIKRVAVNLRQKTRFIEIEVPAEEILMSVPADDTGFEEKIKRRVIDYIKSIP